MTDTPAGDDAHARRGPAADRGADSRARRPRPRPRASPTRSPRPSRRRPTSTAWRQARGLTVGDSGLFARDEPLAGLGFAPAVAAEAFTLDKGTGERRAPDQPGLRVHRARGDQAGVRAEARRGQETRCARPSSTPRPSKSPRARAAAMAQTAAKGNFAAAAKAAGVDVKSTDFVTRGSRCRTSA